MSNLHDKYDSSLKQLVGKLDNLYHLSKSSLYTLTLSDEGLAWQLKNELQKEGFARDVEKAVYKAFVLEAVKKIGFNLPSTERFIKSEHFNDREMLIQHPKFLDALVDEKVAQLMLDSQFIYSLVAYTRAHLSTKGWSKEDTSKLREWEEYLANNKKQISYSTIKSQSDLVKSYLNDAQINSIGKLLAGQTNAGDLIKFAYDEKFLTSYSEYANDLVKSAITLEKVKEGNEILEKISELKKVVEIVKKNPPKERQALLEEKTKLALIDGGDVMGSKFFSGSVFSKAIFSQLISDIGYQEILVSLKADIEFIIWQKDSVAIKERKDASEKIFNILDNAAVGKWPDDKIHKIKNWREKNIEFFSILEQAQEGKFENNLTNIVKHHQEYTKGFFKELGDLPFIGSSRIAINDQKEIGLYKNSESFYSLLIGAAKDYIPKGNLSKALDVWMEYLKAQEIGKTPTQSNLKKGVEKQHSEQIKKSAHNTIDFENKQRELYEKLRKEKYEGLEKKLLEVFGHFGKDKLEHLIKTKLTFENVQVFMSDKKFVDQIIDYSKFWGVGDKFIETLSGWQVVLQDIEKKYPMDQSIGIKALVWVLGLDKNNGEKKKPLVDRDTYIEQQFKLHFVNSEALKQIKFFANSCFTKASTLYTLSNVDSINKLIPALGSDFKKPLDSLNNEIQAMNNQGDESYSLLIHEEFNKRFDINNIDAPDNILRKVKHHLTSYEFNKGTVLNNFCKLKYVEELVNIANSGNTETKLTRAEIGKLESWKSTIQKERDELKLKDVSYNPFIGARSKAEFFEYNKNQFIKNFDKLLMKHDLYVKDVLQEMNIAQGFIVNKIINPNINKILTFSESLKEVMSRVIGDIPAEVVAHISDNVISVIGTGVSKTYNFASYYILSPILHFFMNPWYGPGKIFEPFINNPLTDFLFGSRNKDNKVSEAEIEFLEIANKYKPYVTKVDDLIAKINLISNKHESGLELNIQPIVQKIISSCNINLGGKINNSLKIFQEKLLGNYKIFINQGLKGLNNKLLDQIEPHTLVRDDEWEGMVSNFINNINDSLNTRLQEHFLQNETTAVKNQIEQAFGRIINKKLEKLIEAIDIRIKYDLQPFLKLAIQEDSEGLKTAYKKAEVFENKNIISDTETIVKTTTYVENYKTITHKKLTQYPNKKIKEEVIFEQVVKFGAKFDEIDHPDKILAVILERVEDKGKELVEGLIDKVIFNYDEDITYLINNLDTNLYSSLDTFVQYYTSQVASDFKYGLDEYVANMKNKIENEFQFSSDGSKNILNLVRETSVDKSTFSNVFEATKFKGVVGEKEFTDKVAKLLKLTKDDFFKGNEDTVTVLKNKEYLEILNLSILNTDDKDKISKWISILNERELAKKNLEDMHKAELELKSLDSREGVLRVSIDKLDEINLKNDVESYLDSSYLVEKTYFKQFNDFVFNSIPSWFGYDESKYSGLTDNQMHNKYQFINHGVMKVAKVKFFSELVTLKKLASTTSLGFEKCNEYLKSYNVAMVKFTDIFSDYKHDSELINGKVNNLSLIEKQLIEDYNLPVPSSEDQALWQDIFQQYSQLAETHNLSKLEYEIDASKLEINLNHEKSDL